MKAVREVRGADGILRGYQPTGRFIEVPYVSYGDWIGLLWVDGTFGDFEGDTVALHLKPATIAVSTAWASFDAYQAATGNELCPGGKAWLGPDANDRLTFLTGVMGVRINEVRRVRRRF